MRKANKRGAPAVTTLFCYPVNLEHQLRKHILSGEAGLSQTVVNHFFYEMMQLARGDYHLLKSWLIQACLVLYHKSWQVGAPLPVILDGLNLALTSVTEETADGKEAADREEAVEQWRIVLIRTVNSLAQAVNVQIDDERLASKIKKYIQANFHRDLTIQEVAEAVHVDSNRIRQVLMTELGLGFNEYLLKVKLGEAKKMLAGTEFSVAEIARLTGFHDTGYFIRLFKRCEGITPGHYARDKRLKETAITLEHGGRESNQTEGKERIQRERDAWISILGGDVRIAGSLCTNLLYEVYEEFQDITWLKIYSLKLLTVFARKGVQIGIPAAGYLNDMAGIHRQMLGLQTCVQVYDFMREAVAHLQQLVSQHYHEDAFRVIEAVKKYVQHNYSYPLQLGDLARLVNFSPYHLARLFNRMTGQTLYNYITYTRIEAAKRLICTTDYSIEEIAERVGYQDSSHFMSVFKKKVGQPPRKYAEALRDKERQFDRIPVFEL